MTTDYGSLILFQCATTRWLKKFFLNFSHKLPYEQRFKESKVDLTGEKETPWGYKILTGKETRSELFLYTR